MKAVFFICGLIGLILIGIFVYTAYWYGERQGYKSASRECLAIDSIQINHFERLREFDRIMNKMPELRK